MRKTRLTPVATLAALALTGCLPAADVAFECPNGELLCEVMEITADRRPMATGVDITGVYIYQATEYALHENDSLVLDPGPIVAGRDSLFRVTVDPHDDWESREVSGRLYIYEGGDFYAAFQDDLNLNDTSELSQLQSTFNFEVPGALLQGDVSWEVKIVEADSDASGPGDEGNNEYGPYDLPMVDTMGGLRMYIVPIEYNGDGSGRLPVTTDSQIEVYREAMLAHYGAPWVEIEVGEVYDTTIQVDAGGGGWSNLLSAVGELRGPREIEDEVYIYGSFCPADGGWAGVVGLSNLASGPGDSYSRASIGVGYTGESSANTMVHEVGHAHGRSHTDGGCGSAGTDPAYPHEGGYLGNRGWDMRTGALIEPEAMWDYMSYCNPTFTSDWTYEHTHDRIVDINQMYGGGEAARLDRRSWHTVYVHSDGTAEWGSDRPVVGLPGLEWTTVELLDEEGEVIGEVDGRFDPWDHVEGGVVTFRQIWRDYDAVRIDGLVLYR